MLRKWPKNMPCAGIKGCIPFCERRQNALQKAAFQRAKDGQSQRVLPSFASPPVTDDSRRVFLAVTYSFNMTKNKYRGKGAGQAEKNRL